MRHEVSGKSEKGRNDRLCGTIVWMYDRAIQVRVCKCTEKWKEMGYQLDLGPNCYAEHGIGISAAPEECGKELTEYYVSEKNDCLISCGGGELMCEDLDYVDFEKIRKAPENGISAILTIRILRIFCRPSAIRRLFTVRVRVISAWSRGINP